MRRFTYIFIIPLFLFLAFKTQAAPSLSSLPVAGSSVQVGETIDYSWSPVSTRDNCIAFYLPGSSSWSNWNCLGGRVGSYTKNTSGLTSGNLSAQVTAKKCSFFGWVCSWDYSNTVSHNLIVVPSTAPPPAQNVTADIKVNGSDSDITVPSGSAVDVTWFSTHAGLCTVTPCTLSFPNTCSSTFGEEIATVMNTTDFTATCFAPDGSEVSAPDSVRVNIGQPQNTPPRVSTLPPQAPADYCVNPFGWILSWNFSDADPNSFQSAYQITINDAGTGRAVLSRLYYSSSQSFAVPAGALNFNKTYSWHIKVWDDKYATAQASGPNFSTLPHSAPVADFNWRPYPQRPSAGQKIDFFDQTSFYDTNISRRSWFWTWPDGWQILSRADQQNFSAKSGSSGNYSVILSATDGDGLTCNKTKTISVGRAVPIIKEIFPH